MEDRHTLSEPRLKTISTNNDWDSFNGDNPPTTTTPHTTDHNNHNHNKNPTNTTKKDKAKLVWQVDIYRKGVSDPVDTIDLDDTTLPPRLRKGKVVWRLPSTADRMPSFGTYEVRRILDIFKERKKNRRKTKSKQGAPTTNTSSSEDTSSKTTKQKSVSPSKGSNNIATTSGGESTSEIGPDIGRNRNTKVLPSGIKEGSTADEAISSATNGSTTKKLKEKKKKKKAGERLPSPSNNGSGTEVFNGHRKSPRPNRFRDDPKSQQSTTTTKRQLQPTSSSSLTPPAPPGLGASSSMQKHPQAPNVDNPPIEKTVSTTQPDNPDRIPTDSPTIGNGLPPGLQIQDKPSLEDESKLNHIPEAENLSIHNESHPTQSMPTSLPPGFAGMTQSISRFITIPQEHLPPPFSQEEKKTSNVSQRLSVPSAKAFIDMYYPHITHGLSSDLTMYYTKEAQKSVSVGGAHSVVASREKITQQLSSLAGSVFEVRGVVAQDTFDVGGVHLLITGTVQTVNSHIPTTFAHSVLLTPAASILNNAGESEALPPTLPKDAIPYSFQIHNDALSLLTFGEMNMSSSPTANTPSTVSPSSDSIPMPVPASNVPSLSPWHESTNSMGNATSAFSTYPRQQSNTASRLY